MKNINISFALLAFCILSFFLYKNATTSIQQEQTLTIAKREGQDTKELEKLSNELLSLKNSLEEHEKTIIGLNKLNHDLKENHIRLSEENTKLLAEFDKIRNESMKQKANEVKNAESQTNAENLSPYKLENEDESIEGISKSLLEEYEEISIGKTVKHFPAFIMIVALRSVTNEQRLELAEIAKSYEEEVKTLKVKYHSKKTNEALAELKNLQQIYYRLIFPILTDEQKKDFSEMVRQKIELAKSF